MAKGRSLEKGLTNQLYGTEIADIMERFGDAPFQIQVWKDLAATKYKLYDAVGMWLQSKSCLTGKGYEQVLSSASAYIDETIAPDYFRRIRTGVADKVSFPLHRVNYATKNFTTTLSEDKQIEALAEFHRASLRKKDWFYSLAGGDIFAAENETGGYTIMLAEDY